MDAPVPIGYSACPHDCPSTCALEVELLGNGRIGRVRGSKENTYTAGVICSKVSRYAERIHHPDRLLYPLRRKGPKGSREFERISWEDALDITAEAMLAAERKYGPAVWPYWAPGLRDARRHQPAQARQALFRYLRRSARRWPDRVRRRTSCMSRSARWLSDSS